MSKAIDETIDVRANAFAEREYEVGDIDRDALRKGYYWGAKDTMDFALSHQWRSVEDELPEDDTLVVAHSPNGRVEVLRYHDAVFIDELGQAHCVDFYMPIPSLNPEQR